MSAVSNAIIALIDQVNYSNVVLQRPIPQLGGACSKKVITCLNYKLQARLTFDNNNTCTNKSASHADPSYM